MQSHVHIYEHYKLPYSFYVSNFIKHWWVLAMYCKKHFPKCSTVELNTKPCCWEVNILSKQLCLKFIRKNILKKLLLLYLCPYFNGSWHRFWRLKNEVNDTICLHKFLYCLSSHLHANTYLHQLYQNWNFSSVFSTSWEKNVKFRIGTTWHQLNSGCQCWRQQKVYMPEGIKKKEVLEYWDCISNVNSSYYTIVFKWSEGKHFMPVKHINQ